MPTDLEHIGRPSHTFRKDYHDANCVHGANCIQIFRQFKSVVKLVNEGNLTELQAARSLLSNAHILETTRTALIRSCSFRNDTLYATHSFLRPFGCADGHGNTPLHWASFKNEKECVSLLLHYNADPNARAHPSGWTPLHDAAYSNSSACIELLSKNGAQIDAKANSGATPLCFAAQEDASEAAQLLLDRGADLASRCAGPPAEDDGTQYNFHLPNHPHSRFSGYTPLHYCAHYNAQRASHVLLNHPRAKIAMEVPDLSGRLPIHVAVARGSSDVLRALLHSGARVDTPPSGIPTKMARHTANFSVSSAARTRRPTIPEEPRSPNPITSSSASTSPVTSPVLRSMIPSQPINSSKPWNCLSQQAIDECKELILKSEQSWSPDHHLLFTPQDRKAVMELLRVGKRLEQNGTGIFIDLWPSILGFCGRGWFDKKERELSYIENVRANNKGREISNDSICITNHHEDEYLALPRLEN
jgi:ankyrin repeat protein